MLNKLAFSNAKLKAKKTLFELQKGNIYEIICPNDYFEDENDGFIMRDLEEGNYCQVIEELTDELKETMDSFEFPIIEWNKFSEYFEIVKG